MVRNAPNLNKIQVTFFLTRITARDLARPNALLEAELIIFAEKNSHCYSLKWSYLLQLSVIKTLPTFLQSTMLMNRHKRPT